MQGCQIFKNDCFRSSEIFLDCITNLKNKFHAEVLNYKEETLINKINSSKVQFILKHAKNLHHRNILIDILIRIAADGGYI